MKMLYIAGVVCLSIFEAEKETFPSPLMIFLSILVATCLLLASKKGDGVECYCPTSAGDGGGLDGGLPDEGDS
jgi:hypothetical protein